MAACGACAREGTQGRGGPAADGERVPEKSGGLLRAGAAVAVQCAVIDAEKATYKIAWMPPARRAPLVLLCLAQPGRDRHGRRLGVTGTAVANVAYY